MENLENEAGGNTMTDEERDQQMHNCMTIIWKAYRTGDVKTFNTCFADLYARYQDATVQQFVKCMGLGLAAAVNKKAGAM
jgi:hypothetical protein